MKTTPYKRTINYIIIHCSASRANRPLLVSDLEAEHRRRGFRGIGYHYYITRDGEVHSTRPEDVVGAHTRGWNKHSIGVCYEGGLDADGQPADTRTPAQRIAMHRLVAQLLQHYPHARLCGHRDLSPDLNGNGTVEPNEWVKLCPCFDVRKEL